MPALFPALFRWRLLSLVFLPLLAVLAGCSPYGAVLRAARGQQIRTEPAMLEAQGEVVPFTVTARVPLKVIRHERKLTYKIELTYHYDERSLTGNSKSEFVGMLLFGIGDYQYDPIDKNWLVATKSFTLPFTPAKHPGTLRARGLVTLNGADPRRFVRYQPKSELVAPGILTTTRLVVSRQLLDFTPERYKPSADSGMTELPLYFPPGYAIFSADYGTNAAQLQDFIQENLKTTSIRIVGLSSPEEAELKHPRLAQTRAKSVKLWCDQLLTRYGYRNSTESIRFSVQARPRDWALLLERVEQSALTEAQIDEIFDIVNGPGTYAHKAARLNESSAAEYLQTYVYPMMRRALVTIKHAPRPQRPDYELYLVAQRIADGSESADALTEDELRYAASLTPLLEDKRRIYEGALKTGLSWPACHNLGVIYVLMAEKELSPRVRTVLLKKAVKNLTYAAHRNPLQAELWYHLATAQQRLGNTLEALHAYDYAAKGQGTAPLMRQIFADKGALELVAGQPDDALASMQYAEETYQTVMNRGLASLLKGDYITAASRYEHALTMNPEDGGKLATYSRAVTAARAKDDTALSLWLTRAVALDPAAAPRATEDLEFREYVTTELFRAAVRR